ncbi:hypothetical protein MsAg5_05400 [Methanosarcinaceae archaeon Ag5]|uniref:Uncharacterized protein n=1 Tax=Methanolapillus africanus TaxID=3028297 RepID=A0AAE4MIZ2_9EURY|nr:hypothetical protein [Methanosarcinaceae archaeon Ag5]
MTKKIFPKTKIETGDKTEKLSPLISTADLIRLDFTDIGKCIPSKHHTCLCKLGVSDLQLIGNFISKTCCPAESFFSH